MIKNNKSYLRVICYAIFIIYLLFLMKNIYDIEGDKVETSSATKDELQMDKHIKIKGYKMNNEFFATEIIIMNFKF